MKGSAEVILEMEDPRPIYEALLPETEDHLPKSRVCLELGEKALQLTIEGDDVGSLRAALNTWVRLVKIAMEMVAIEVVSA